jgi:hypothetical protein
LGTAHEQITEAAENTLSWTSGYDVKRRKCFLVVACSPTLPAHCPRFAKTRYDSSCKRMWVTRAARLVSVAPRIRHNKSLKFRMHSSAGRILTLPSL